METASKKVLTPYAILSYPSLVTAREPQPGSTGKAKFQAVLVFPAGTDLSALRAAAALAVSEKFTDKIKVGPKTYTALEALDKGILRSPFRTDAEAKGYTDGSTFCNVKTESKPQIYHSYNGENGKVKQMTDDEVLAQCYPGAWVRASVTAFAYEHSGNKGASFALNTLQFVKDGDRLDSRVAGEDEFTALNEMPADISALVG